MSFTNKKRKKPKAKKWLGQHFLINENVSKKNSRTSRNSFAKN